MSLLTPRSDLEPTALEVASHAVVGAGEPAVALAVGARLEPFAALEVTCRAALSRPPCLVSFSGGHDSSLILGLAVRVARREGLSLPVPITWRFVDAPLAEESELQESVVRALELTDWIRLDAGDDLDFVGPISRQVLRRHGLLYPANAFLHLPLLERADGGTVLTGFGGDHVLGRCPRSRRPWWLAKPPGAAQVLPWLRHHPAELLRRSIAQERHGVPRQEQRRARWRAGRRDVKLACASLAAVAKGAGSTVVHPLLDDAFLDSLERCGVSAHTAGGRAGLIEALFGDILPTVCVRARPKARFGEVFWRRHTKALLANCDFDVIDDRVVDRDALREEWSRPQPNHRTALLVQQVWLASDDRDEQSHDDRSNAAIGAGAGNRRPRG